MKPQYVVLVVGVAILISWLAFFDMGKQAGRLQCSIDELAKSVEAQQ